MQHLTIEELEARIDHIRNSPAEEGPVLMIVRRPDVGEREVVDEAELDQEHGLLGDSWERRRGRDFGAQLTIINSRLIQLVAQSEDRWPLAGDQLVIDFDISAENLPPGTRLSMGTAVVEISQKPHTGCGKFQSRFGRDAMRFVNAPGSMKMRLRGVNARIVKSGTVSVGDVARKLA